MNTCYPPIQHPATADYVLAVIRDDYRQQCQYDPEAERNVDLKPDSTIAEWRNACNLLPWRQLGRALNAFWDIDYTDEEWRNVLQPAHEKRLSDVCELVARRMRRPVFRPARLLGRTCYEAGVFLTIRSLLADAGAKAGDITPSTSIAPFTRSHLRTFLGPIARLSPGALPLVTISVPAYHAYCKLMLVSLLMVAVGLIAGSPCATILGIALITFSYAMLWHTARCVLPQSVEFGHLRTFRDLAKAIAADRAGQQSASA